MWTLAQLIDYEVLLSREAETSVPALDAATLAAGRRESLKAWLQAQKTDVGDRYLRLRSLSVFFLSVLGLLLGWGSVRALLPSPGAAPANIQHFLLLFVVVPLLFLFVLLIKGLLLKLRLFGGLNYFTEWLLQKAGWKRFQNLHPGLFALESWLVLQAFALAYYLAAAVTLLLSVTVHDYVFSWQTTLREIGPEGFARLIHGLAWPFGWIFPAAVPSHEMIQATQFDSYHLQYRAADGNAVAGAWWPFLLGLILCYGFLPRLVLSLAFHFRLQRSLRLLRFDDFASEALWLRLQRSTVSWKAQDGTTAPAETSVVAAPIHESGPLLVIRWRQAPFSDADLRAYFSARGFEPTGILDAEGHARETQTILDSLRPGMSLALVSESWEMPGEAFNQLRLAIRRTAFPSALIFLAPLENRAEGLQGLREPGPIQLWKSGLKAFQDTHLGLLHSGDHSL